MYQFYYADPARATPRTPCQQNMADHFQVTAIRPTMWEEHCLECSAPYCFETCVHYQPRIDGRCKRFANGLLTFPQETAVCGQGAHVKFRKWGNLMTVLFPGMLSPAEYAALQQRNEALGRRLKTLAESRLPLNLRWFGIRTLEFLRRKGLGSAPGGKDTPDAFLFQGYSYHSAPYSLILEIYDDHTPVFKTALPIRPGENLHILPWEKLDDSCARHGFLVKLYPEGNLEAELDILWCDFVQGTPLTREQPAPTVKCLVWDLDNTLWQGTLAETEDPKDLTLKPQVLETIRELDRRGILQSVASKNDFSPAWDHVRALGLEEYFLYPQIHWDPKSGSMESIARSLNIGVDSLAFLDDMAFEREQVRSALPQVRVYSPEELAGLLEKPEFQVPVTEESRNRRQMYRAEEQRSAQMQSSNADALTFLKTCNLALRLFAPETPEAIDRCFELIARTNQLNMTGKKYTREEFHAVLAREGCRNLAFSCRDAFGSYGTVGFAQYQAEGERLVFTEFAMSCRAAGKYVESAFFSHILARENCREGIFPVVKTKKNALLRNTLTEIGFRPQEETADGITFRFDEALKHWDLVRCEEE